MPDSAAPSNPPGVKCPEMNDSLDAAHKPVQVTLYTRPGCHLCEEAKVSMRVARCVNEYTLREVNIESDARLLHSYRNDIPVVFINGVEAFRHRVAPEDFERLVAQAQVGRNANDIPPRQETP